jgi:type IV pilus assembly protein PilC
MLYRYSAYTTDKKIINGTIESTSIESAEDSLYKSGFRRILDLQKTRSATNWKNMVFGTKKIKTEALLDFTTELVILIQSGMTLLMALKQLEKQSADTAMKGVIASLAEDIQGGSPFHTALGKYPQIFSETYCCVMEANEKAGTLDAGLQQIAKQLRQQMAVKNRVTQALTQPLIIIGLAIVVAAVMAVVVLPQLVNIFNQFGTELPWNAKLLIAVANFINDQKFSIIIGLIFFAIMVAIILKNPGSKPGLDKLVLKLPLVGQVIRWNSTAYFSRVLSNLLSAGILLPDAINIMLRGISNTHFRAAVSNARKELIQGQSLSSAIAQNPLFPPLLVELIGVGESSGNLEHALGTVADYFDAKVEKRINKLISIMEPALIIAISLVVGLIAITMISSIYGLVGSFQA